MDNTLIVLGRYSGQTFIPDSPLPHAEGAAQLIITPTTSPRSGSIADAFGTALIVAHGGKSKAPPGSEQGIDERQGRHDTEAGFVLGPEPARRRDRAASARRAGSARQPYSPCAAGGFQPPSENDP